MVPSRYGVLRLIAHVALPGEGQPIDGHGRARDIPTQALELCSLRESRLRRESRVHESISQLTPRLDAYPKTRLPAPRDQGVRV